MTPDTLPGKRIILGVTGGIAAYKSALLVRELVKRGAEVRVVMTPSALEFITPLTLSTLSGNEVIVNTFPADQKNGVELKTWHIDYGMWADLMIIAPATVNTIAKITHGFADNALTTLVAALRKKLLLAPAADMDMYETEANLSNLKTLEQRGAYIVDAEEGFLASGLIGRGRMADIDKIVDSAELCLLESGKDLEGKKVLVTAGPTFEDIDPVRFIGNRSSGKMGFAIAKAAFLRGADVTLVSGPVSETAYPEIKLIKVRSAEQMLEAVAKNYPENDILVMSAAVADYAPETFSNKKIKKKDNLQNIRLKENSDILRSLQKIDGKFIAGFALETNNAEDNARKKLESKGIDMIILNSLEDAGAGFEHDSNKISIISKNHFKQFPLLSKFVTANNILTEIKNNL
ncbi:MAG: phosphopantothenoylcysteine decarboxylase [Melioribacteraceae bacterium]|nr:MAG: phosphopantothenoylcysteine decarboxylase [Melioribacteraceae bacterium]